MRSGSKRGIYPRGVTNVKYGPGDHPQFGRHAVRLEPKQSAELLPENAPISANEVNGEAGIVNGFNFRRRRNLASTSKVFHNASEFRKKAKCARSSESLPTGLLCNQ